MLDSNIHFKVSSELKEKFKDHCKENYTNVSSELKRFMNLSVKNKFTTRDL